MNICEYAQMHTHWKYSWDSISYIITSKYSISKQQTVQRGKIILNEACCINFSQLLNRYSMFWTENNWYHWQCLFYITNDNRFYSLYFVETWTPLDFIRLDSVVHVSKIEIHQYSVNEWKMLHRRQKHMFVSCCYVSPVKLIERSLPGQSTVDIQR